MRVLVTGAAGFIGRHVVEELRGLGHEVRATDLPGCPLAAAEAAGAEALPGDLLNADDVSRLMDGITHVVHCAAAFDLALPLQAVMRVNRDAARMLCEEAGRREVVHFLHLSTGGVYGSSLETPMREDHPHHPEDSYSLSKEAGESAVAHTLREYGVPLTIFRPTAVYGPFSTYIAGAFYVLPSILRYAGVRRSPSFRGGKYLTLVHVRDIAGAVGFCLDNPAAMGEDFNLAEDRALQAGEFFDLLFELFDMEVACRLPYPKRAVEGVARLGLRLPVSLAFGPLNSVLEWEWKKIVAEKGLTSVLRPRFDRDFLYFLLGDHYLDASKIRALGYASRYPTCLEGLRETIDWYRRERWLP